MSDSEPKPQDSKPQGSRATGAKPTTVKEAVEELPRAKKVMLALAALFIIVGLGLSLMGGSSASQDADGASSTGTSGGGDVPAMGLVGGGPPKVMGAGDDGALETGADAEASSGAGSWSPFFVKGGFSFALAFCVGYAARMFFKLTTFIVGVYALGLFGLAYIGWVDVDWNAISLWWDGMLGSIQGQAASFKTFITGSLPSAGLGTAGLVTGFRKG